ncbi:MAG: spore gernimation protein [Desulfosporosinus sp. BRH_c37]|nr:MAG: spore gernimation protein [Desulfosporosinus sp. BRH_c37]
MTTAILFVPGITAERCKQSAWLATMLASLAGFVSLWTVVKLGQRFPRHTLPQYGEILLGKALGKIVGGAYVFYFLVINILVIREFSDFLTITLMPETPGVIFSAIIVLIASYASSKGLEVIARMAQFVLPLFVFTLVFLLGLATPNMELGKLQPFLEGGILPVIWGSLVPASWYGEIVVLVILLPMVNKPQEIKLKGAFVLLAALFFLTADTLITLTIFGPYLTGDLLFPFWFLAKYIEFGNYLQRMESLIVLMWVIGIVIKVAVLNYLVCFTTAQVLSLKGYKPVVYVTAFIQILGATFLFKNTPQLSEFLSQYWPPLGLLFEIGLPLILLMVAVIRGKQARG